VPISINLNADDFSIPWKEVEEKITEKTRMIIINTPHNPSGAVLSSDDMDELAELIANRDIVVLSDEVYEHLIYDGHVHQSVLKHPRLREKSIAVYSFGKTFHATGWKMGYTVAPAVLTEEIRKVHQFMVFSVNPAIQMALADHLVEPDNYNYLSGFFQKKRDALLSFMSGSRFEPMPCLGTYFQAFSYQNISDKTEMEMATWVTEAHGVATIPFSPFYVDGSDHKHLRICFAKSEETLKKAADKLCLI
jgi:methionine aminotransferase